MGPGWARQIFCEPHSFKNRTRTTVRASVVVRRRSFYWGAGEHPRFGISLHPALPGNSKNHAKPDI